MTYRLASVLLACVAGTAVAQPPRVGVDRRVELMVIVFKLAGSSEFNQNRLQPYQADIERHFGRFRDHPAIALTRSLRDSNSLYFDRVPSLAVHVSDPPELRELLPFDRPRGQCCTPATSRLLEAIRRFAVDSRADEFFAAHRALYDTAGARMRRLIDQHADLGWFAPFFGTPPDEDFVIVPMLANSGTNFGPAVRPPNARHVVYAILGHEAHDSAGFPVYDEDLVATLVHEFNHSFANRLVNAFASELEGPASRVHALVTDAMREQGYGSWRSMMYESLVDASVARYFNARDGEARMSEFTEEKKAGSWFWLSELATLLAAYEADRARYPTLRDFMPRVVAYLDSLPDRVVAMKREYDERRPTIASVSIENGAQDVDPALTEIIVRFNRPVRSGFNGVTPVQGGRQRFPRVTSQALDTAGTTLRLGVQLQAGRAYEFRINTASGNGFRGVPDGVPLAPYVIRFSTRSGGGSGP